MNREKTVTEQKDLSFEDFKNTVLADYRLAHESRQASLIGRKEVLTGKAKFGIFGDGKEVAQIAMAKVFRNGDFRSGYYRDQTFMFAIGALTVEQFFAQLYANPDVEAEPSSAGRSMNGHYATRNINPDGSWKNLMEQKNSSADISPTGGQMPRLLGLAYASKLFRNNNELQNKFPHFTNHGNEVAFGTIGDASTSEGLFWETINAAGVLQVPMTVSVWDDGYGISVPAIYQTTKQSISEVLKGFEQTEEKDGYRIFTVKGWNYPALCETYEKAISLCREHHIPVLIHVEEMTQPQGHSTSGSHERYKSKERLEWETEFDCLRKMREWIIETAISTEEELDQIEADAKKSAADARRRAWDNFMNPIKQEKNKILELINSISSQSSKSVFLNKVKEELNTAIDPQRKEIFNTAKKVLRITRGENTSARNELLSWLDEQQKINYDRYSSTLYNETKGSALKVEPVALKYADDAPFVDGREVLLANFDAVFEKNPLVVAFGEDLGKIGDVNQGFAGLQSKYTENRIVDTGIREATITGQGIGLAMRGFRPIAEIQYLDYLLYAIQILSDDLATLQYRTKGGQIAPVIIRTRGHRLEGIWHSGSPMGMIINSLRGMHVLVPRNMTQAAGFYNTMLASQEPALIIEPLNGYRLKEKLPSNAGEYKIPLGIPETIEGGTDVTVVTYGSCCRIAQEALPQLREAGISVEIIDVQSLLPFDINHSIVDSLKKTNKLLILDEDVPGGASAFILQQILEEQKGYYYLDTEPLTLTSKAHRPAYGSDGDYFSKPSADDVYDAVYKLMRDTDPERFPDIFS